MSMSFSLPEQVRVQVLEEIQGDERLESVGVTHWSWCEHLSVFTLSNALNI